MERHEHRDGRRRGVAAAELAAVLPMLCFIAVAVVDYGRVMSASITLEECARNGAVYMSQAKVRTAVPYASLQDFARAGATQLSPAPTVTSSTTTDSAGRTIVTVTAAATFTTYARYPGIPHTVRLSRSAAMYVGPD